MSVGVGIGLAFVAMLCWGFGDFLIQRSTRKIGDVETLFFITAFGALVILPFVYTDLAAILGNPRVSGLLVLAGVVIFVAALLEFEALRRGKLAVVEPVWSLEIPVSVFLAFVLLDERLSGQQFGLIVALIIGLLLVSFRGKVFSVKWFFERGVFLSVGAAAVMGAANFLVGWGSRASDALMVNFVVNVVVLALSGAVLIMRGRVRAACRDFFANRSLLLPMAITDNAAWVAFAFAMALAPIGVAVALSESYIIIAVILGLAVNKEKLGKHQKFGLILALLAAIVLAAVTA